MPKHLRIALAARRARMMVTRRFRFWGSVRGMNQDTDPDMAAGPAFPPAAENGAGVDNTGDAGGTASAISGDAARADVGAVGGNADADGFPMPMPPVPPTSSPDMGGRGDLGDMGNMGGTEDSASGAAAAVAAAAGADAAGADASGVADGASVSGGFTDADATAAWQTREMEDAAADAAWNRVASRAGRVVDEAAFDPASAGVNGPSGNGFPDSGRPVDAAWPSPTEAGSDAQSGRQDFASLSLSELSADATQSVDSARQASQSSQTPQPSTASQTPQSKAARPRTGTIVACGILGALFLALAVLVYAKGVLTNAGQGYDTMVWWTMSDQVPLAGALSHVFHASAVVLGIAGAAAALSVVLAAARRRVGLLIQLAVFAAFVLLITGVAKDHLPRPVFNQNRPNPANSAPSGHTLLFTAAMVALLLTVPRAWRAWVGLIGWLASSAIGLALVAGRWHRPSDVVMSIFIAGALACIVLAFSRGSGMDRIAVRKPSAAVQIIAPALIVLGVLALLYSIYGIWQLLPNLGDEPTWGTTIACESAVAAIVGSDALVFGVVCALRQLTASPLTGTGIFGTPPRPPKEPQAQTAQSSVAQ